MKQVEKQNKYQANGNDHDFSVIQPISDLTLLTIRNVDVSFSLNFHSSDSPIFSFMPI